MLSLFILKKCFNSLRAIVEAINCDEQRANYSEPDWVIQRQFDDWVRDMRTPEGKQMQHAFAAITDSVKPGAASLDPQEIVLLLDVSFMILYLSCFMMQKY